MVAAAAAPEGPELSDLLSLAEAGEDIFDARCAFDDEHHVFGGQLAAQALLAAGRTVTSGRAPHSLRAAFLRAGDPTAATRFWVLRDRNGRSFSVRRVEARQGERLILTATASFHSGVDGAPCEVLETAPDVAPPSACEPYSIPRLRSFEGRWVPQPYSLGEGFRARRFPVRFWARCTDPLVGRTALLDACVTTYLSDISNAGSAFSDREWWPGPSLDHSVWINRSVEAGTWLLVDLSPIQTASGRATYSGRIFAVSGALVATLAQESVHLPEPVRYR